MKKLKKGNHFKADCTEENEGGTWFKVGDEMGEISIKTKKFVGATVFLIELSNHLSNFEKPMVEETTCKYFIVSGYWKDDKSSIDGYIIKEFDDVDEDTDDQIFYYGLSESNIKQAIEDEKNGVEDSLEFAITSYEEITL